MTEQPDASFDDLLRSVEELQAQAAQQLRQLAVSSRSAALTDEHPGLRLLTGMDDIQDAIRVLAERCRAEQLSMHPNPPGKEALAATEDEDRDALARGIRMRGLLTTAVRSAPHAVAYYQSLVDDGLEMRVTDRLSALLIIVDREVALLHVGFADDGRPQALLAESELVVASLCDLFDRTWDSARPLGEPPPRRPGELTGRQVEILRLAVEGWKDDAIARQLGVSTRTLSHEFSAAMALLGARSRFQAGALWASRLDRHADESSG